MKGVYLFSAAGMILFSGCFETAQSNKNTAISEIRPDTVEIEQSLIQSEEGKITLEEEMVSHAGGNKPYNGAITPIIRELLRYRSGMADSVQDIALESGWNHNIVCRNGTVISLNTGDFENAGSVPDFRLKVVECLNKRTLQLAGLQTSCEDRPLDADGAMYVAVFDGRRELKLRKGKKIRIQYPRATRNGTGIFYAVMDSMGRMYSTSTKRILQTQNTIAENNISQSWFFTNDTMENGTVLRLLKIQGNKLQWKREMEKNGNAILEDTIDFASFSRLIYRSTNFMARTWFIPVKGKMIPLENIQVASIRYNAGEKASELQVWIPEKNTTLKYIAENKPAEIEHSGWLLFARFMNNSRTSDLTFRCQDSTIHGGMVYLVFEKFNCILSNTIFPHSKKGSEITFHQIPVGSEIHVLFIAKKGENIISLKQSLKTGPGQTISFDAANDRQWKLTENNYIQ